jgi:pimeloyl-ACP methyl ester carboxylesterase
MTVDAAVDDVIDVTNYLRNRFERDRIYLLGQSWGSLLGVLAAQREPQLFHAFIGTGQMVSPTETDNIFYLDTLAWARQTGRSELVEELTDNGPPPYSDVLDYEAALSYEQEVYAYDHSGNSEGSGQMSENIFVEEYSVLESVHVFAGFLDTFALMYPQMRDIDLRTQASTLAVPVFLAQGAHEARGRAEPAGEWFDDLQAPAKERVVLDSSGHRPLWEQPEEFAQFMTNTVLPGTTP